MGQNCGVVGWDSCGPRLTVLGEICVCVWGWGQKVGGRSGSRAGTSRLLRGPRGRKRRRRWPLLLAKGAAWARGNRGREVSTTLEWAGNGPAAEGPASAGKLPGGSGRGNDRGLGSPRENFPADGRGRGEKRKRRQTRGIHVAISGRNLAFAVKPNLAAAGGCYGLSAGPGETGDARRGP